MKPAAMIVLLAAIFVITGISAELRAQPGDWYSRGIIRQQTVDLIAARQKRQNYDSYLAKIRRLRILQRHGPFTHAPGPNSKKPVGGGTTVGASNTTFQPVEQPFVPQQLAARLGNTDQERKYIEEVLIKCLNFYTDTARQKGVPLYDVARALNYYVVINYFVYTMGAGPTKDQMDATREMIRANMVEDETFRRMSDREKQESYETLIVLAGFVDLGYGTAKQSGNEKLAAQFREMAKYNLETVLGAPVEKIHFTEEGWLSTEDPKVN